MAVVAWKVVGPFWLMGASVELLMFNGQPGRMLPEVISSPKTCHPLAESADAT